MICTKWVRTTNYYYYITGYRLRIDLSKLKARTIIVEIETGPYGCYDIIIIFILLKCIYII